MSNFEGKLKVKTTIKAEINLSAEDWCLYGTGAVGCAVRLNTQLRLKVADGISSEVIIQEMRTYMSQTNNLKYGAGDSEPDQVLVDLVNEIFNTKYTRYDI